ncbi:F-box/WD repeat-containing protein 7-like [Babylonia areolata]|uniref:F-box/WD repeat-containing protein 7-like n=1 Tax=Babylonia areolata TaxID=304850 RepID=UPI003FD05F0E
MAKRRTEALSATPAVLLDTDQSNVPDLQSRNRKGKQVFGEASGRSGSNSSVGGGGSSSPGRPKQGRKGSDSVNFAGVSTRTRAQTKQQKLVSSNSSRRVTRQQKGDLHHHHHKEAASASTTPTTTHPTLRPGASSSTVATSSPLSSVGRATRSRSDLRLRDRSKVDTPDVSCHGDLGGKTQDDDNDDHINGNNAPDNDNDGEEEEEEEVNGEDDDDDREDCEEEGCRCTSNWSCGGHSGLKRAGPCSSTPRLQTGGKRRLASGDEQAPDDGDVSPSKKGCRSASKTRQNFRLASGSGTSSTSPINRTARQRIPSREHPPPKLQQWLDTFKSWSNAERMMALDDLITLCEPSQVRHMMQIIEPQFQRDFISLLPKELALHVLSYLDPKDLLQAAQTCRYWRVLCEDNLLWREKCREEGIDENLVYGSRLRRRPGLRSPCKALYMRQSQIEHNWRQGMSRAPKILKGHDDHVITCLEFCGQRIVSGSDDNTLKVWSVVTGKCLRNLVGHTGGVWSSQMAGNIIISGSTDRSLKVWNADTGVCKYTLYGHTSTVRCMSLCGNRVVSGSRDATLRVWDIETGQCLHMLMGHVAAVRCVQYDGRRVVSGAYDYTVRIWDPETETCLHTLQGHSNRVYSLQFDGVHVVSGSLDTSIRVWEVETGACLHTLIGHQSLTSGLELKDNILVSGNADSTVKVWDITTGQCLQTLQGPNKHQSAVTCLQFNKKFVITSSDDGTVKIWDLKTGEFLRNLVSLESGGSGGVVWRLRCNNTKLVCAVGSRNGTEETKLMVLDFDVEDKKTS